MPPSESTPLIGANGRTDHGASHQPTWAASLRWLLLGSYFNVLLIFVPLSVLAHTLNWDAGLRFLFSFIAIVPLAKLLGDTTEQMSLKLGQTLAGLLNATFGNAVEIIVGLSALLQGQIRIVQTSMLGSILSNILLVLGCSFLAGGIKFNESEFQVTAAQTNASLMTLACITLVIPAAYHSAKTTLVPLPSDPTVITPGPIIIDQQDPLLRDLDQASRSGLLIISRGTALLLLAVYVAYLFFQLKTHHELFRAKKPRKAGSENTLVDAEAAGAGDEEEEEEEEEPDMNMIAAGVSLLTITVITSFVADFLVASIEETAERYHIPKPFIGLILLPIVANAAEHVTSVWMAMKDKMELTIGICVGSSIQIATFVVPLLVIVGWISGHELTLFFDNFETVSFFVSVLLVNLLIQDGKSNYMEGLMLITLYLVIALAFWVS
ncbi:Calcium/proton exchanger [Dentipellis sp. KUC8613]|nr:Calcium/proton exchanger [Dentipellis sp. KUC8613]